MFAGRNKELKMLSNRYSGSNAELMVLYGEKRIGKTALVRNFIKDKHSIYLMTDYGTEKEMLKVFSEAVIESLKPAGLSGITFDSWESLLGFLGDKAKRRLVVVIDEFTNVLSGSSTFLQALQEMWDRVLKNSRIFLILCSSTVNEVEEMLREENNPLQVIRTSQIFLEPIAFPSINDFFPRYSFEQMVQTYAILGGKPAYLRKFDPKLQIFNNIRKNILSPDSFLYNEVRFLLMHKLRDLRVYFAILKSVATGNTRLNDILADTGLPDRNTVSRYINLLEDKNILARRHPVTEKQPHKSRKGIYRIKDNFTAFWFRFVYPNMSYIEEGNTNAAEKKIKDSLHIYVSSFFSDICTCLLKKMNALEHLPFRFEHIGGWWNKNNEIDIVAYNSKDTIFCECSWTKESRVTENEFKRLIERADITGLKGTRHYYMFSRHGFSPALVELAGKNSSLRLFDLNDLEFIMMNL